MRDEASRIGAGRHFVDIVVGIGDVIVVIGDVIVVIGDVIVVIGDVAVCIFDVAVVTVCSLSAVRLPSLLIGLHGSLFTKNTLCDRFCRSFYFY